MLRYLLFTYLLLSLFVVSSAFAQDSSTAHTVSIEGTLLMLDNKTPHVAVPVEAIRNGEVVGTVLSSENGEYQFVNLESGRYQVRCQVLGGYVYYRAADAALRVTPYDSHATGKDVGEVLYVGRSRTLGNINFRFAPFKKGTWKTYTYLDGLAGNSIEAMHQDADGNLWFATRSGGVSRYDGKEFVNFTTKDGLAHNDVKAIYGDPDGTLWFGTKGGVSRYDGKEFVNFTTDDGLVGNYVTAIDGDPDGTIWFGTGWHDIPGGGVSRYDGKEFKNFTKEDGLVDNTVLSIYRAPDGAMWFGTLRYLSRYDGKEFVNFTREDGLKHAAILDICGDFHGNLWFGTDGGGVYGYDGKKFTNFTTKNGLAHDVVFDIYQDSNGVLWFATGFQVGGGVSRYDGKTFVNFTVQDGLPINSLYSIYRTLDGAMWFGTNGGGVSRYDDKGLLNFTTKDGLVSNPVHVIHHVPDDILWFGTNDGVSRYDGKEFVNFTMEDGLAHNSILDICGDSHGNLWFGTWGGGVSRYDGKKFENFTTKDGLHFAVYDIHRDADGAMWFGTWDGAYYYDGERFSRFTKEDGLAGNNIPSIQQDTEGYLWFGTVEGEVYRYDGNRFESFTEDDGLANFVTPVYCAPDGAVWLGTKGGGVSRYDGKEFRNLTVEDGLASNAINDIYASPNGVMWFGTDGGVSRYDGTIWTSLDTRDGLAGNNIRSIQQDTEGYLWFGTLEGGVTRYRPSATPPKVRIVSVRTRKQVYKDTELDSIPPITVGDDVTIECGAIDFRTVPEKRQYRHRVKELDSDWRAPVKSERFDWTPEDPGTYTFEVQAIDRDLNYSEPASVSITISAIPFYKTGAFTVLVSIIGSASLLMAILLGVQRWRLAHDEKLRLQREMDDARQMQLNLLPETAPTIEGFDIAGSSRPAREVGGDFFDYLSFADGKTGIALCDVSGKGLKGAMNAVLTSGMLNTEAEKVGGSCGGILSELNTDLCPSLEKSMFVALRLASVNGNDGRLQWANAAQPYPLIKRGDQILDFSSDGELPLGIMPDVTYPDQELELQSGDTVIFYTDGIIEAENGSEEMYGSERLEQFVAGMDSTLNAEETIEAIFQDVTNFVGNAEQYDDMTVVVAKRV